MDGSTVKTRSNSEGPLYYIAMRGSTIGSSEMAENEHIRIRIAISHSRETIATLFSFFEVAIPERVADIA
jgi:hypothetical protein